MQIVEVDAVDAEIDSAALDLVGEKPGIEAVPSGHQVFSRHHSRRKIFSIQVGRVLFARLGRSVVERHIAALGAYEQFVARRNAGFNDFPQGPPACTFRALTPVVDGGVEYVQAARHARGDDLCI